MLRPRVEKGRIVVDLINPWDSEKISCSLTLNQLKTLKCFDSLESTRVK